MKTNAEYHKFLAQKHKWARNAAKYCRVKAATIRDEAVSKIYADIAAEADAEADKIYRISCYYFDRCWKESFGNATPQEMWDDFTYRRGIFAATANA